jgi:hypothetical protein
MKTPALFIAALCAFALDFSTAGTAQAEPSAISIRVEQSNRSTSDPKDHFIRTHIRSLNIFVTNNSSAPAQLKVKHIIFGREMIHHDFVTIAEGEAPLTVKPHTTEKIETPEAKVVSTDAHFDAKAKKAVAGAGATIIGSGVQVMQDKAVVAEFYDPASIKERWGKTIVFKAPAAAPAKKK